VQDGCHRQITGRFRCRYVLGTPALLTRVVGYGSGQSALADTGRASQEHPMSSAFAQGALDELELLTPACQRPLAVADLPG